MASINAKTVASGLSDTLDMRAFIDQLPIGVAVLDVDRRIVWMNRVLEALTGFSQADASGIACHHILRQRICLKGCPLAHMGAESESVVVKTDLINRDRMRIPVNLTQAPLINRSGDLVGFLEAVEDLRGQGEYADDTPHAYRFADLIGRSPQMEKLFRVLPALAQHDSSILITGETGTGKDRIAEHIHKASARAKAPFIKVNCGALPETLLESELFGHVKGAFTGAVENKPGRFRLAHGGTLFLTEVGDLPLPLQVKLLTFLDDHIVYPLGSTKGFQANVRVIGATHRNLELMVREGRFRQDLLFRLNVVRLHIPPLRERDGDVRLLLDHFLNDMNTRLGKRLTGFSPRALDILKKYPYPGNVRELRNIIEYAANICQDHQILPKHLPSYLTETAEWPDGKQFSGSADTPGSAAESAAPRPADPHQTWDEVERRMIVDALVKAGGKRSKAADILGWGRSTLWRKMKQYGL